jgi:serine/threonine-protein kinase HipA
LKLPPNVTLEVSLRWSPTDTVRVGRLGFSKNKGVFEYDPAYVASGKSIHPGQRPGSGVVTANTNDFHGLHGMFSDSLPDAWGRLLLDRQAEKKGVPAASLTTLDRLAYVGKSGMGALIYQPGFEQVEDAESFNLTKLAMSATRLLSGTDVKDLGQLAKLGGPSGGARPKVLIGMNAAGDITGNTDDLPDGYQAWLVKFRMKQEFADIGPLEAAYASMALSAGLEISETKLIGAEKGPGYFATKRFDRGPGNTRMHFLSASGILEAPMETPAINYDGLLRLTAQVTRNAADVEKAFRRAAFKPIAHNRDHQIKQHGFLMDRAGKWRLAPAYDLTFSNGPGGEHYLDISGEARNPQLGHLKVLGQKHGVKGDRIQKILDSTIDAVERFSEFANAYGVSKRTLNTVKKTLDEHLKNMAKAAPATTR